MKVLDLKEIKCKHISTWTFDESLRNKEYLLHIFEVMTFGNNSYLLWCDGHNEIVFYPLSERCAAIEYFANAFFDGIRSFFLIFLFFISSATYE